MNDKIMERKTDWKRGGQTASVFDAFSYKNRTDLFRHSGRIHVPDHIIAGMTFFLILDFQAQ